VPLSWELAGMLTDKRKLKDDKYEIWF